MKIKSFLKILLLFAVAFLGQTCDKPKPAKGSLQGTVKDDQEQPLSGVEVKITGNTFNNSYTTGSDGTYQFVELDPNQYELSVKKSGYEADNKTIQVQADVAAKADFVMKTLFPVLYVSTTTLDFGSVNTLMSFDLKNNTAGTSMNYQIAKSADWISLNKTNGTLDGGKTESINVTIDKSLLQQGTYKQTIVVSSNGGSQQIEITVIKKGPVLSVTPTLVDFGNSETSKTIYISNSGIDVVTYTASVTQTWMTLGSTNGSAIANQINPLTITIDRNSQTAGAYAGTIVFNSNSNSIIVNVSFTKTLPGAPILNTKDATNISQSSASVQGEITSTGNDAVTQHGHCWSTTGNPTVNDNKTTAGAGTAGIYTSAITGLQANTVYYARAYATNGVGTSYGNVITFTTSKQPTVPTVSTVAASNVTYNSATLGGNVTEEGTSAVTTKGICYNTSGNPTIADSKTANGTGLGGFTATVNGLNPSTKYYVRAYATNTVGTAYGEVQTFTTLFASVPSVTTVAPGSITANGAASGGNVTADNGSPVTARGVCWNTTGNPTISDSKTANGTGTGTFTSTLTGLNQKTTYYIRSYATNANGTGYGDQQTFTTLENLLPTSGLVAYYPFNGNANDESGNGNNGTVNGATLTTDRKGVANRAYSFDGVSSYIGVSAITNLTSTQSKCAWIKLNTISGSSNLYLFDEGGNNNWLQLYDVDSDNKLEIRAGINGYSYINGIFEFTQTNNWYFIVSTVDNSGTMKIYINGTLDKSGYVSSSTPLSIAIGKANIQSGSCFFNGLIDDVRIYNRALNETEIQQLYNE